MTIHVNRTDTGVIELVMDNPPVNALNIADTYALADLLDGCKRDDTGPRSHPDRHRAGLLRRCRHQGDAGPRGQRGHPRGQRRLLRGLPRRLRVRRAGHRRRQRLLPRHRHRTGRQRRHRHRGRGCGLRAARGRQRCARCAHAPAAARAPTAGTPHALHLRAGTGRRADELRHRARRRGARPAATQGARDRVGDRRRRTRGPSEPPSAPPTASTRSTSAPATASNRASPTSSTSPARATVLATPSSTSSAEGAAPIGSKSCGPLPMGPHGSRDCTCVLVVGHRRRHACARVDRHPARDKRSPGPRPAGRARRRPPQRRPARDRPGPTRSGHRTR